MKLNTDGRFYELEGLVRANCQDCIGCCDCCTGMGDTIVLDPYDLWNFKKHTGQSMQQLIENGTVSLTVVNGLVLPHIQMNRETDRCPYLNEQGRCSVHSFRPGMCRLFPLGRNYEDGKLNYILLKDECKKNNRSKIKVSQWIGVQPARQYHEFVLRWHDFRKYLASLFEGAEETQIKEVTMYVLQTFFFLFDAPEGEFFTVFFQKMDAVEAVLK